MFPPLPDNSILRNRYQIAACLVRAWVVLRQPICVCRLRSQIILAECAPRRTINFCVSQYFAQLPDCPKFRLFTDGNREYLVMDFVAGQDLPQITDEQCQAQIHLFLKQLYWRGCAARRCTHLFASAGSTARSPRHQTVEYQADTGKPHQTSRFWVGEAIGSR